MTLAVVLDPSESLADLKTDQRYRSFANELEKAIGEPVRLSYYRNSFTAIKEARDAEFELLLAPAHVIANVVKLNFTPVLKSSESISAAFVAGPGYQGDLAAKSGARLGLPSYESLLGSMARSEINNRGLARADFKQMMFHRIPEAPLYGLKIGSYDLAVASADEAKTWAAANQGRIVFSTTPVPLRALSVRQGSLSPAAQQKIISNLQKSTALNLTLSSATTADFKGVASMLNTTPATLPGIRVIDSAEAKALIEKGTKVFDVRLPEEFDHGHIPGAILVPYDEASAKEVDFIATEDKFDLRKLPADKNETFLMYCDGTICWKSYKAARMAMQNGWKNVLWFRGGLPAWKEAGLPVEVRKK
jgi:rhodanese-related sulfurtransferase